MRVAQVAALTATVLVAILTVRTVPALMEGEPRWGVYVFFVVAGCYLALAWGVLWRAGHEPVARALVYWSLAEAVYRASFWAPGGAGLLHVVSWLLTPALSVHFSLSFLSLVGGLTPQRLRVEKGATRSSRLAEALVESWVSRASTRWLLFGLCCSAGLLALTGEDPRNLTDHGLAGVVGLIATLGQIAAVGVFLALASSFVWTAYRASDAEHRRRIRWILLGATAFVAMHLMYAGPGHVLLSLLGVSGLTAVKILNWALFLSAVLPAVGCAVAVLYDGALDAQPLIDGTALYSALGAVLLFLFGGVEVVLGDVVLAAIGAPNGASTVIAGGTVAIAFGPLRIRFKRRLDHWLHDTLPARMLAQIGRAHV